MDLIGTIEVALFGGAGNNVEDVENFMSMYSRSWSNYDYQILEDGEFVDIEIYSMVRNLSVGILYDITAELNDADFDASVL